MLVALELLLAKYGIVLSDEEGQGLIEYVLIGGLIAVAAIIAMQALGGTLDASFDVIEGQAEVVAPAGP